LLSQCEKQNLHFSVIPILGSITNKQRIEETIKSFSINTIYHAAAYKHVTLIEHNIREGILNNIFGSYNVARAALDLNVENFILISTDKAVRPTSIMGATKRIAELITLGLAQKNKTEKTTQKSSTHFAIVRFGNVLGSSGSVIPLFQQQIASGGPITITHPEVTRYFMTIAEASQLVIQAGAMGGNCNIFVLDMGNPISILSLAKQLVYLSGHMLKTDENEMDNSGIEIQYTGLRKGEKIHEELFIGDIITSTEHPLIMKAKEASLSWVEIEKLLKKLDPEHNLSEEKLGELMMQYSLDSNGNKPV
jgi:FlaA1/EpsC-like NDP-sugar epimerase